MTIVSYSEIYSFQTCMRQYYYANTLDLRPVNERGSLKKGISGHRMLQSYYDAVHIGKDKDDAMQEVLDNLPTDLEPEMLSAYALVNNFVQELDKEIRKYEILYVEEPFLLRIDNGLTIGFTPDIVYKKDAEHIIEDGKFISRMWPKNKLTRYTQLDIYNSLLRKLGIPISKGYIRFLNVETGRINKQLYNPDDERLKNIYDEFITLARKVKAFKDQPVADQKIGALRTLNYHAVCQGCDYVLPCDFELSGKDASKTLLTQYIASDYGYLKPRKDRS